MVVIHGCCSHVSGLLLHSCWSLNSQDNLRYTILYLNKMNGKLFNHQLFIFSYLIKLRTWIKSVVSTGNTGNTSITGTVVGVDVDSSQKVWKAFQAFGDIAFAYSYSMILIEIQVKQLPAFAKSLFFFFFYGSYSYSPLINLPWSFRILLEALQQRTKRWKRLLLLASPRQQFSTHCAAALDMLHLETVLRGIYSPGSDFTIPTGLLTLPMFAS